MVTPESEAEEATEEPVASSNPAAGPAPGEPDQVRGSRDPLTFDADDALSRLVFSVTSDGRTKEYDLSDENKRADLASDWPDGISRTSTYNMSVSIDIQKILRDAGFEASQNGYRTVVEGDAFEMGISGLLRENSSFSGRLQDPTAAWNGTHNGVGDYSISSGKLTIRFDRGYLDEKQGEILSASIQVYGGFDLDDQTTDGFTTDIAIGSFTITTKFPALEIVRNLSIEKSGSTDYYGPYVSNSSPSYPRQGGALVDADGFLVYTVKLTAGKDNTYKLTNVKVTDLFDESSRGKVDPGTMELVRVVSDSSDKTASATALRDADGNVNGWNIGDLPAGAAATVTYKVKIDKEELTRAVAAEKAADASSDAHEARTVRNTATASADSVDPVSDDFSTTVKNYVSVSKRTDGYDYATQTQRFSITVAAPADNRYTQYDVPVRDYLSGALDASRYRESGISSMTVTHSDGSSESVDWGNFSQPDSRSWHATIPEMRPGDKVEIRSYTTLDNSYWTNRIDGGRLGDASTDNYVYAGNVAEHGLYSADLNRVYDHASFGLYKNALVKNSPSINPDGTVSWSIVGNGRATSSVPTDVGGKTVTDVLGENQEFEEGLAAVTFYNQDGTVAGSDSIPLAAGSTSFSYTIPERYGTCEYRISYKSRITDWDTYVGPAKAYTNTVGYEDGSHGSGGTTSSRPRVASMTKTFVQQEGDWSRWRTAIYSELEDGDVYTDTSRGGVNYMYFTPEDLAGISLAIDGVPVDAGLYSIVPVGGSPDPAGRYASFKIAFKGDVSVAKDGETVRPSKSRPLVVSYKAHMVNPPSGMRDYYNDAELRAGNVVDSDYDYCRRNNTTELVKSVQSSSNGYITWYVRANYYGYSGQPDGTCTVTDTLPAGTEYVSTAKASGAGQIESAAASPNEDGTTTLTVELSGLGHDEVSKNRPSDNNGSKEFHFTVKTRITDPGYLYGKESKTFRFTNNVSLEDRYGNPKKASATASVQHVGMSKTMTYTAATAPYANFEIRANADGADLNPDGDTVGIVDKMSPSLSIDTASFSVVGAADGREVPFSLDTSKIASDNQVTVNVPDATPVKVSYRAQVLGFTGETVTVGNEAWWEGHEDEGGKAGIEKAVEVLKASGQAVSVPMVWFSKRDANDASALGGGAYGLEKYSGSEGWTQVRDGIETTADGSVNGVKVGGLSLDTLYRLTETVAPSGYVLDPKPIYFALSDSSGSSVEYPPGIDQSSVFKGAAGSVVTAYDAPYVPVRFEKKSDDGVLLAGAALQVLGPDGRVARAKESPDADGSKGASFETSSTEATELYFAPGSYVLRETSAPKGYDKAPDLAFVVDSKGTVTVDGKKVQSVSWPDGARTVTGAVVMVDAAKTTSLKVSKAWDDRGDFEKIRPGSVEVQLFADGEEASDGGGGALTKTVEANGPDGLPGTDDDWTAVFEGLDVMRSGRQVSYSVKEIDPGTGAAVDSGSTMSDGYLSTVSATTGDAAAGAAEGLEAAVTNSRAPAKTSVSVSKEWDDDGNRDGARPEELAVGLYVGDEALTGPDGKAVTATLGAENNWFAEFSGLDAATADGSAVPYAVKELDAEGKPLEYGRESGGYTPRIASITYSGYPAGVDPTNGSGEAGRFPGRRIAYAIDNAHAPATMSVGVEKKWVGPIPGGASVVVRLLSDDNPEGKMRDTGMALALTADGADGDPSTESDNWKGAFPHLPVFKNGQEGRKVTYEIVEDGVAEGYRASYSYPGGGSSLQGSAGAALTVTVTNAIADGGAPPDPESPAGQDRERSASKPGGGLLKTGDAPSFGAIAAAAAASLAAAAAARRRIDALSASPDET